MASDAYALLTQQAITASRAGNNQQALAIFLRALDLRPDHGAALMNAGSALVRLGRFAEALVCFDRAVERDSDNADVWMNRGAALRGLGRVQDALRSFDRALALRPAFAELHYNRGNALRALGLFAQAVDAYDRALALRSDYAIAQWNRALALLGTGDYERGWRAYEEADGWQIGRRGIRRDFGLPLWLGQASLAGQTILLHAEQGLGDTLQFCRYVPLVVPRAGAATLGVQPELVSLIAGSMPGVRVLPRERVAQRFDWQCPLMSLPLAFQTRLDNIPNAPYLRADPVKRARWSRTLGESGRPRVGLVWRGGALMRPNPHATNPLIRNLPLALLSRLDRPGIDFVSLQKGEAALAELRAVGAGFRQGSFRDPADALRDFSDTAALLANLDLVITIDTSIAHLAGAMGVPVWIMLAFDACWRWLRGREDSPWYPGARLYRQPASGDWASVIDRVVADLTARYPVSADDAPLRR